MTTRHLLILLMWPALAGAQIIHTPPGRGVSVGEGIRLSVPGYDGDAVSYFARATVMDAVERRRISDFITGLKALGAWGHVTDAWLLRGGQNAGDGSTAYGLKGNYNGTFLNAPGWSPEGVVFTVNAGQAITTSIAAVFPRTLMLVQSSNITAGAMGVSVAMGPTATGQSGAVAVNAAGNWSFRGNVGGTGFNLAFASPAGPRCFTGYVADGLQRIHTNGTLTNATTLAGTPTPGTLTTIAGMPGTLTGASGTVTIAFAMVIEGPGVDAAAIYHLYKTTIGTGLGLP